MKKNLFLIAAVAAYSFGLGKYDWPPMPFVHAIVDHYRPAVVSERGIARIESRRAFLASRPAAHADILMLGDSITQDGGDWTEMIPGYSVKNRGVGYATTKMLLDDLDANLRKTSPRLVFVLAGINDIRLFQTEPRQVLQNLQEIARRIRAAGAVPVMQSILPPAASLREPKNDSAVAELNSILSAWCWETGTEYVDLGPALAPSGVLREDLTYDGIHPNFYGYMLWQEKIEPVAKRVLGSAVAKAPETQKGPAAGLGRGGAPFNLQAASSHPWEGDEPF